MCKTLKIMNVNLKNLDFLPLISRHASLKYSLPSEVPLKFHLMC